MNKTILRKMILEEIKKLNENSESFEVRKLINTIHSELKRLKSNKNIDNKLTSKLFLDFKPLFKSLDSIATFLANKND